MKHGILNLLHLTKIYKRLLVVLPPATPADESLVFSFQLNGTEGKWRIPEKGISEKQTGRNTVAPI